MPSKNKKGLSPLTIQGIEILQEIWRPNDKAELSALITDTARRIQDGLEKRGGVPADNNLRLVLEEAALNAWLHGNKCDPDKTITVRWGYTDDLLLEVVDQGPGFDPDQAPDPTAGENICKPSGRGIFLIRYYSQQAVWSEGGRRLTVNLG